MLTVSSTMHCASLAMSAMMPALSAVAGRLDPVAAIASQESSRSKRRAAEAGLAWGTLGPLTALNRFFQLGCQAAYRKLAVNSQCNCQFNWQAVSSAQVMYLSTQCSQDA